MAVRFDNPTDEQTYHENITELYSKHLSVARVIGDHFVVADNADSKDTAMWNLEYATTYAAGAAAMAEAYGPIDVARSLRGIMLSLLWATAE